jgi:hypothetical protein
MRISSPKLQSRFLIGHIQFGHEGVIAPGVWMAVAGFLAIEGGLHRVLLAADVASIAA